LPSTKAEAGAIWGEEEESRAEIEAVRRKSSAVRWLAFYYSVWLHNIRYGILNERIRQRLIDETMQTAPPTTFVDDACSYTITKTVLFQKPQELIIEGQECYRLDMTVTWKTRIIRPPIVSKFDIKTRGRVITYDSGEISSVGRIQLSFIEIE
jgi:hypothetical protein